MPATCKVITLKGNPKHPESCTHIIEFPGGSIELSRTSNNEYWAHIAVNQGQVLDADGFTGSAGQIVGSRIDRIGYPIEELNNLEKITHLAVRITTKAN